MRPLLLLVEPDWEVLWHLARALSEVQLSVMTVVSAEEALRVLTDQYQYLVTEAELPDLSGLDLVRICQGRYPRLHSVVVTRTPSVEDALAASRAGAADYLIKPFTLAELLGALNHPCEQQLTESKRLVVVPAVYEYRYQLTEARRHDTSDTPPEGHCPSHADRPMCGRVAGHQPAGSPTRRPS